MATFDELLQALKADGKAAELLGGKSKPDSGEEIVAGYIAAAKELGFDLTAQDVVDGIKAMAQERLAKTEQAEAELRDLAIDELDSVAGGAGHDNCKSSYEDYENCWWDDGCDLAFNGYDKKY